MFYTILLVLVVLFLLPQQDLIVYSYQIFFNGHGASVAQEQQKVGCHDSETSNGRSKRAKTLAIGTNYSTNEELYVWPFTV